MMACAGLSVKPLGALLPKRTSGTHVVFHLCPCTHILESGRSKTDVRVCVCAWGGIYFQTIWGLFTTTNPLVGRCVCECIHL